jgi:type II secretory pathway pseudopilin PulG
MKRISKRINEKGYTLAELAISTSILAMLAVGGLSVMGKKNEADNLKETYSKLAKIEDTLASFINVNRYVPCPAGPQLFSSHPRFGYEVEYNETTNECDNDSDNNGTAGTDIDGDGDSDGDDILTNATGAVPVRTLGLPDDYMYDGWDRKFTYRISNSAGSVEDFDINTFHGDIGIMDRRGIHKTDINNLPPNNNGAIYVIISHGSNGKDVAWAKNNNDTTPGQAAGVEGQNTNHESKNYIQAPKTETFDDIVEYGLKKEVIPPYNVSSPLDASPLTCENATEIIEDGRNSTALADFTTSVGDGGVLADQIYENALILSELCNSAPTEIKVPSAFRGLVLWLDANDSETVFSNNLCTNVAADSGEVECWLDKSDNNNRATTTGTGPTFSVDGLNSRNVLVSNGSDELTIDHNSSLDSVEHNTFFLVSNSDNGNTGTILSKRPSGGDAHFEYLLTGLSGQQFSTDGVTHSSNSQIPINKASMYSWHSSLSNNVFFYQDGELVSKSASTVPSNLPNNTSDAHLFTNITGGNTFDGMVGEVVLYNTSLSSTERSGLEVYLSDKWSIPLNTKNSGLCPPGMEFVRDYEHPEGACQCTSDGNYLVQELSSNSACLFGNNSFNKCEALNTTSPEYTNAPTSSGMALWLDANDCTKIMLDGDGNVSMWADRGPNAPDSLDDVDGYILEQSTSVNKPSYSQNTKNTNDTITFDGNDFLTMRSPDSSPSDGFIFSTDLDDAPNDAINIFAVARTDNNAPAGTDRGYIYDFGNENGKGYGISFVGTRVNYYVDGSPSLLKDALWKTASDYAILSMIVDFDDGTTLNVDSINSSFDAPSGITQVAGAQVNESNTRIANFGPVTIGASSSSDIETGKFFEGDLGEVIVYIKNLTAGETLEIENYLSDKWAINNNPNDVNSLELWLDASDYNTLLTTSCASTPGTQANSDDGVQCWRDKTANNNDAEQTDNTERPLLLINAINGLPSLDFDGTDDYMTLSNSGDLNKNSDLSLFVVSNVETNGDQGLFSSYGAGSYVQYSLEYVNAGNIYKFLYDNGSTLTDTQSGGGSTDAGAELYSGVITAGGEIYSYFDAVQNTHSDYDSASGTPAAAQGNDIAIGAKNNTGTDPVDAQISEILFFSSTLTDGEREYIELYLAEKWDVTINME